MGEPYKILLLDDDPELLAMYREMLGELQSRPKILTATSGARAIALLEEEDFSLLMCDLKMPKMDGLQVLTIVRRKFPHLRTAVMTSVADEQVRARAYAMGIDLFLEKPATAKETQLFQDCVESLLGRGNQEAGFRGVQSKSLVDIIQLECLSQSSSVIKVTNGLLEGRIWFQDGEIIDAETAGQSAEPAFHQILSWKTGNFEILPADPGRTRTIFNSYQGLLLESAQALDEQTFCGKRDTGDSEAPEAEDAATLRLKQYTEYPGVDWILEVLPAGQPPYQSWGVEDPDQLAQWVRQTQTEFQRLGDQIQSGQLNQVEGYGLHQNVALVSKKETHLCTGFQRGVTTHQLQETMRQIISQWAS
jgi:CheY-like chemotaxis protein